MYPYEMYKQSGDNKQNMAVLYSPYQSEPLMTINDPYGDEDWENKAINGISAIVDEYDYFVIYRTILSFFLVLSGKKMKNIGRW